MDVNISLVHAERDYTLRPVRGAPLARRARCAHALWVVRVHVGERRCVGDTFELIGLVASLVILAGIGAPLFYKKRRTAKAES